jgi:hypothetical protein
MGKEEQLVILAVKKLEIIEILIARFLIAIWLLEMLEMIL